MIKKATLLLFVILCYSCSSDDNSTSSTVDDNTTNPTTPTTSTPPPPNSMYFPPITGSEWENISPEQLGWNSTAEQELYKFLEERETSSFIILKNGKIAIEKYFNGAFPDSNDPWYSIGKTLTAMTVGIAQQNGILKIDEPSSKYLGQGWSELSNDQEQDIQIKHHLSMNTGLDYTVPNNNCTDTDCLKYRNPVGSFWYYHNAPYTLITKIIANATQSEFNDYVKTAISSKIGMTGNFTNLGFAKVYHSNARSMARFGLLSLNKGFWGQSPILTDKTYYDTMINSSQTENKAYGYSWWLNGKENYRLPASEKELQGSIIPEAPKDLIAGLGKNDQKLYIIPSQNMVIVRMGKPGAAKVKLGLSTFDNELWSKINALWK